MNPMKTKLLLTGICAVLSLYGYAGTKDDGDNCEVVADSSLPAFEYRWPNLKQAYDKYIDGDFQEAITLIHKADDAGENANMRSYLLGLAYAQADSLSQAYDLAFDMIREDIGDEMAREILSTAISKNPGFADELFRSILPPQEDADCNKDSVGTMYEVYAQGFLDAHSNTLAYKYADIASSYRPSLTSSLLKAASLRKQQRFDEALAIVNPLVDCESPSIGAIREKCTILRYMKQHDKEIKLLNSTYKAWLQTDDQFYSKAHYNKALGEAYAVVGNSIATLSLAVKCFNESAGKFTMADCYEYRPSNAVNKAEVQLRTGICLSRFGYKEDDAKRYFNEALASGAASDALCYAYLGDRDKAIEAIGWDYSNAVKAAIYYVLGDIDTALSYLESAFAEGEYSPAATEVDINLQGLTDDSRYKQIVAKFNPN